MIWNRKEGSKYRVGINFMKTGHGHGIVLKVPLIWWTMRVGYYWGITFNRRWYFCNNKAEFQRKITIQIEHQIKFQLRELIEDRMDDKIAEKIKHLERKVAKFDCFIKEEIWKR